MYTQSTQLERDKFADHIPQLSVRATLFLTRVRIRADLSWPYSFFQNLANKRLVFEKKIHTYKITHNFKRFTFVHIDN